MNQEQYETLKGLIAENELACIVFGRAAENYDKNDILSMNKPLRAIKEKYRANWDEKSKALHDFIDTLKDV